MKENLNVEQLSLFNDENKERVENILNYIVSNFEGYNLMKEKDMKFYASIITDFPNTNIEDELKQFYAWTLDNPEKVKNNFRSKFRSWLKNSGNYYRYNRY
jgi:hypothetical protein